MTIEEAGKHGDVGVWYNGYPEPGCPEGWYWDVNCGYQSWGSSKYFDDIMDAYNDLIEFLKTWEGPTK